MRISLSNPLIQTVVATCANYIAEKMILGSRDNRLSSQDRQLELLEREIAAIKRMESRKAELEQEEVQYENSPSDQQEEEAAQTTKEPVIQTENQPATYSRYAPWMTNTAVSCVACGTAHLGAAHVGVRKALSSLEESPCVAEHGAYKEARDALTDVSAWMKEASRFAREDGVEHPEVKKRLTAAQERIVELERQTLSPENLSEVPDQVKETLEGLQPKLRSLRQALFVGVEGPETIVKVSSDSARAAQELWGNKDLAFVDEEISALLKFDWDDETIKNSPPEERVIVSEYARQVRELHEQLRNQPDRETLQEAEQRIKNMRSEIQQKMEEIRRGNDGNGASTA